MAAVGTSMLLGIALARLPAAAALTAILTFLGLGVWCRGTVADPSITTEMNLEATSRALARVRSGFAYLRPQMPQGTQILLSTVGTGSESVPIHLYRYQALKVWYDDPTLEIQRPERRKPWAGPELLFRVMPSLDVVEFTTNPIGYRTSGSEPTPAEFERPIRSYSRGLAGSGETDRAVKLLLDLGRLDSPTMQVYDARLASMILYQAGRPDEARRLVEGIPFFPRAAALDMIAKVLIERAGSPETIDSTAFLAFGVPEDVEGLRHVMRKADGVHDAELAGYLATRLLRDTPGDGEALALLQRIARMPAQQRITEPGSEP
jgi:hypothetical protein